MAAGFRNDFTVNLGQFTGSWHEWARTPNRFEDNTLRRKGEKFSACYNAQARYTLESPRKLRIVNTCLRRSEKGTVIRDRATGIAVVKSGSGGRKLQVAFGSAIARAFQRLVTLGGGNYWIYCLGPVNESGQYDWAVVSGKRRQFIFMLTREPTVSDETKSEMLSCARSEGLPVNDLIYRQE